jgi:hypothetical protein
MHANIQQQLRYSRNVVLHMHAAYKFLRFTALESYNKLTTLL